MTGLALSWQGLADSAWSEVAAAWAQAILTVGAVFLTAWITGGERRRRERELRLALASVVRRCLRVLHGLSAKEAADLFSLGNIDASRDEVESALRLLDALPLAQLPTRSIPAYLDIHRQMMTARRRVRFIGDRLAAGEPYKGIGKFGQLLEETRVLARPLGVREPDSRPR